MRYVLACLVLFFSTALQAKETITVVTYNSPAATAYSYYLKIIDAANSIQNDYEFVLVSKPGAQGQIALQYMDQSPDNRLAVIYPAFVELSYSGKIKAQQYVAVSAQGKACWVLISPFGSSRSGVAGLYGHDRITLGTVGIGSAAHLTALILGEHFGFKTQPILFKSNFEALVLMAGDESINLVVESPNSYLNLKQQNPRLQALGVTCDQRNPKLPEVRTLKEQGYDVPSIWYYTMANQRMALKKRVALGEILDRAMTQMGKKEIEELVDFAVPVLNHQSTQAAWKKDFDSIYTLKKKFQNQLDADSK